LIMKSRRVFAIQSLMNAMRQAHADGLFIVFYTLTLADDLYALSLHDALPISIKQAILASNTAAGTFGTYLAASLIMTPGRCRRRSEEHTSELQSRSDIVCRLLLEKKK